MEESQTQTTPVQSKPAFPMMGLAVAGVVVILAVIGFVFMSGGSKTSPAETANQEIIGSQMPVADTSSTPIPEMLAENSYSLADISVHATKEDCWFAIQGKVYDVTEFIAGGRHPGGEALVQGCGQDATELFNTRPMGSGTPHSDNARELLADYQIGVLAE